MCNAYDIGRPVKRLPEGILQVITGPLVGGCGHRLIRRTDAAPVITAAFELVSMRWGFERPRLGTINNTREEKLGGPMWSTPFRERRCVIPASAFFEWSGPKGRKQTHCFTRPDQGWLWIAGLWEPSPEFGSCFSMITTRANRVMAPIHDRMPAILEEEQITPWFAGEIDNFAPLPENIQVEESANPLVKPKEPPAQMELF